MKWFFGSLVLALVACSSVLADPRGDATTARTAAITADDAAHEQIFTYMDCAFQLCALSRNNLDAAIANAPDGPARNAAQDKRNEGSHKQTVATAVATTSIETYMAAGAKKTEAELLYIDAENLFGLGDFAGADAKYVQATPLFTEAANKYLLADLQSRQAEIKFGEADTLYTEGLAIVNN
jgi:hypothetical protein